MKKETMPFYSYTIKYTLHHHLIEDKKQEYTKIIFADTRQQAILKFNGMPENSSANIISISETAAFEKP